jgi:hypothetical protein
MIKDFEVTALESYTDAIEFTFDGDDLLSGED